MNAHRTSSPGENEPAPVPEAVESPADVPEGAKVETAGAFDIRNFIGALLGLFGLILVAMGLFAFGAAEAAKTDGLNANLWAGLALVLAAVVFLLWSKLDPIRLVVRDNEDGAEVPRDIAPID